MVEACCEFLEKLINSSNCVDVIELGKKYCPNLEKAGLIYAQINFKEVIQCDVSMTMVEVFLIFFFGFDFA